MMYNYCNNTEPSPKESPDEINKEWMKRCVYVIIMDVTSSARSGSGIAAFSNKIDVEKFFASSSNPEVGVDNYSDLKLIYGFVLDQKNLPMTIDSKIMKDRLIYVLVGEGFHSVLLEECEDLEEAARAIELAVEANTMEIEDICVILGEEIELVLSPGKSGDSVTTYQVYGSCT